MTFHLEYRNDSHTLSRAGAGTTRHDALRVAATWQWKPVLILEGGGTSFGAGDLVAVVLPDGDIIEAPTQPRWWHGMTTQQQDQLIAAAGSALSADLVAAITSAGGTAVATQWEGQPFGGFELSDADTDWLKVEDARRSVQGG